MTRPLHAWPSWMLRTVLRLGIMRGLWGEAWIELWRREVLEAVLAEEDAESGPWVVAPPRGMH